MKVGNFRNDLPSKFLLVELPLARHGGNNENDHAVETASSFVCGICALIEVVVHNDLLSLFSKEKKR